MKTSENNIEKQKQRILDLESEISKLHQELESLKKSEDRYAELFQELPLPYQSLDANGNIINVNQKWLDLFEYKKSEVLNRLFTSFISPEYLTDYQSNFQKFKETGLIQNMELVIKTKNGKKINIVADGKVCYDNDGNFLHTHCILRDLTERIETLKSQKAIEKKLKQIINEKDKFFSIMAHDLKNPIIGFTELTKLLVEDFSNMTLSEINELVGAINMSALHLNQLLENLLEWSRIQRDIILFNPIKCNLKELVDEVILYQKTNINLKKLMVINEIPNNIFVFIDVYMISSVVGNLLSNAIKFSYENDKIIISAKQNNDFVNISIKDFGVGIEEHNISKLFKLDEQHISYGTAKEKGTGLGLILCKEHLKKHGTDLRVESKLGEGSEFKFSLPIEKN